jgi:hypothetical protein
MTNEVTLSNTSDVINEIENAFFDIPFENSEFQTKNFVINAEITPARAYRALGLRIHNRLNALRAAKYSQMRYEINLEEKQQQLNDPTLSYFDKKRIEIDIMEMMDSVSFSKKLINDAINECNVLYALFKKFPKYTREDFEKEEELHFAEMSKRQIANITGGSLNMMNITYDKQAFDNFFEEYVKLNDKNIALTSMKNTLSLEQK